MKTTKFHAGLVIFYDLTGVDMGRELTVLSGAWKFRRWLASKPFLAREAKAAAPVRCKQHERDSSPLFFFLPVATPFQLAY